MTELIIVRYFHFLGIIVLVACLSFEHFIVKKEMSRAEIKRLSLVDSIYGISALIVLTAGFLLWFWVGKSAAYYSGNWIFHTKLTLFILVGLLSIYPTIYFIKNRKGHPDEMIRVPKSVIMMIRMELLIVLILPLLAVLMSLGIGQF